MAAKSAELLCISVFTTQRLEVEPKSVNEAMVNRLSGLAPKSRLGVIRTHCDRLVLCGLGVHGGFAFGATIVALA